MEAASPSYKLIAPKLVFIINSKLIKDYISEKLNPDKTDTKNCPLDPRQIELHWSTKIGHECLVNKAIKL